MNQVKSSSDNRARYHTAEHILTALVRRNYHGAITDSRFYGNKGRCDYQVVPEGELEAWARELEAEANRIVASDLTIDYSNISREEADGRFFSNHLPAGLSTVRLVCIDKFDATPCCGDHVASTAEAGPIRIKTIRFIDPGLVRLTYVLEGK